MTSVLQPRSPLLLQDSALQHKKRPVGRTLLVGALNRQCQSIQLFPRSNLMARRPRVSRRYGCVWRVRLSARPVLRPHDGPAPREQPQDRRRLDFVVHAANAHSNALLRSRKLTAYPELACGGPLVHRRAPRPAPFLPLLFGISVRCAIAVSWYCRIGPATPTKRTCTAMGAGPTWRHRLNHQEAKHAVYVNFACHRHN